MAKITTVAEKSSTAIPSRSRTSECRRLLAVAAGSPRTIRTLGTYRRAKGAGRQFTKYKRAAILDCFLSELIDWSSRRLEFIRRAEPRLDSPSRRGGQVARTRQAPQRSATAW